MAGPPIRGRYLLYTYDHAAPCAHGKEPHILGMSDIVHLHRILYNVMTYTTILKEISPACAGAVARVLARSKTHLNLLHLDTRRRSDSTTDQPNNGVSSPSSSPFESLLRRLSRRNQAHTPPWTAGESDSLPVCESDRAGGGATRGVVAVSAGRARVSVVGAAVISLYQARCKPQGDRPIGWQTYILQTGHCKISAINDMHYTLPVPAHHFLPLYQPIIHLGLVEQMTTWQNPNDIAALKTAEAYRTFVLRVVLSFMRLWLGFGCVLHRRTCSIGRSDGGLLFRGGTGALCLWIRGRSFLWMPFFG